VIFASPEAKKFLIIICSATTYINKSVGCASEVLKVNTSLETTIIEVFFPVKTERE
jgi:hypothetical protein